MCVNLAACQHSVSNFSCQLKWNKLIKRCQNVMSKTDVLKHIGHIFRSNDETVWCHFTFKRTAQKCQQCAVPTLAHRHSINSLLLLSARTSTHIHTLAINAKTTLAISDLICRLAMVLSGVICVLERVSSSPFN